MWEHGKSICPVIVIKTRVPHVTSERDQGQWNPSRMMYEYEQSESSTFLVYVNRLLQARSSWVFSFHEVIQDLLGLSTTFYQVLWFYSHWACSLAHQVTPSHVLSRILFPHTQSVVIRWGSLKQCKWVRM